MMIHKVTRAKPISPDSFSRPARDAPLHRLPRLVRVPSLTLSGGDGLCLECAYQTRLRSCLRFVSAPSAEPALPSRASCARRAPSRENASAAPAPRSQTHISEQFYELCRIYGAWPGQAVRESRDGGGGEHPMPEPPVMARVFQSTPRESDGGSAVSG